MQAITALKWASPSRQSLRAADADGADYVIPWPTGTWYGEFVQAAINAGVVIKPEDPPPPPIDLAEVDNLERALKALGLVVAQWAGKTPAQLKAAFRTAWESLA